MQNNKCMELMMGALEELLCTGEKVWTQTFLCTHAIILILRRNFGSWFLMVVLQMNIWSTSVLWYHVHPFDLISFSSYKAMAKKRKKMAQIIEKSNFVVILNMVNTFLILISIPNKRNCNIFVTWKLYYWDAWNVKYWYNWVQKITNYYLIVGNTHRTKCRDSTYRVIQYIHLFL